MKDCTVIIPIYKENPDVVARLVKELEALDYPVIVVNDGDTVDLPRGISEVSYYPRHGYGYAIKQGVKQATTKLVCTMDGDGQHLPSDVEKLYQVYNMVTDCKMVIGTRWGVKESILRKFGRKFLNFIASCLAGHYLIDMNSGLRIFDRKLATEYEQILCDTFSYTTSLTMTYVTDGHKFCWLPVDVQERKYGKSTVNVVSHGLITLKYILWLGLALRTRTIRKWLRPITSLLRGI